MGEVTLEYMNGAKSVLTSYPSLSTAQSPSSCIGCISCVFNTRLVKIDPQVSSFAAPSRRSFASYFLGEYGSSEESERTQGEDGRWNGGMEIWRLWD